MSLRKKRRELIRLRDAFEAEAARFHDTRLSVLYITQMKPPTGRTFHEKNHVIMLWQYYGTVGERREVDTLLANLQESDIATIGVQGSEFSCYALIEGHETDRFIRMAKRAGSIFSDKEMRTIKAHAIDDFKSNLINFQQQQESQRKSVFAENDNRLAVWLNHILYHLGKTHPLYMSEVRIDLDPFAASLSAIDGLVESGMIDSAKYKQQGLDNMHFRVALSFPGEKQDFVSEVAGALRSEMGDHAVFYDNYYQP